MTPRTRLRWDLIMGCVKAALFLAGFLVILFGCALPKSKVESPKPKVVTVPMPPLPAGVSERKASAVATAEPVAPAITWLVWNEFPKAQGYYLRGSDFSSMEWQHEMTLPATNRIRDPGWLLIEMRSFSNSPAGPAVSAAVYAQRLRVQRSGGTNLVRFVPIAGRPNRLEASADLSSWTTVSDVLGWEVVTIPHASAAGQMFYRVRVL